MLVVRVFLYTHTHTRARSHVGPSSHAGYNALYTTLSVFLLTHLFTYDICMPIDIHPHDDGEVTKV